MVANTYGTDPGSSRELLWQVIDAEHLTKLDPSEASSLASGVTEIIKYDPGFAVTVYRGLFTYSVRRDGTIPIGPSSLVGPTLVQDRRQAFDSVYYLLERAMATFLATDPYLGTRAVAVAILGRMHTRRNRAVTSHSTGEGRPTLLDDGYNLTGWRADEARRGAEHDPLTTFTSFLRKAAPGSFVLAAEAILTEATPVYLWDRLLGIAVERPGIVDDLLWPLVGTVRFCVIRGMTHGAVQFLASTYPKAPMAERERFERELDDGADLSDADFAWLPAVRRRLLAEISHEFPASLECGVRSAS